MLGMRYDVDGKIWTDSAGHYDIFRLDIKTGNYERFEPMKQLPDSRRGTIYGIDSDSHNNLYFTDFATDYIGRIDAKTGKVDWFQTPTANSRPRRIRTDAQDRAFFGEYQGNRIGMLDPETKKITEWPLSIPVVRPVLRNVGQERERLYRRHDHGPPCEDRSQDRPGHRIPDAPRHQHAPRLRRRFHHARHHLDGQQPRRRDRKDRAARLTSL